MSAAARWRALVRASRAEADRREARLGLTPMYAGERAESFAHLTGVADETDPFFRHVLQAVGPASTVLDVGAGSGRYALALAPRAKEVVAVDPSDDLLMILGRQARRLGLTNIRCVLGRWEDVEPIEADVTVCYGVMGHVEDAAPFFRKLDACTKVQVFVGVAVPIDVIRGPLWRHFHAEPPPTNPAYLDALAVLRELGIAAEAKVHERTSDTYADLSEAVFAYRNMLRLPDSDEVDQELRTVLSSWLIRRRDGTLRHPYRTYPYVTVTWKTRGRASSRIPAPDS